MSKKLLLVAYHFPPIQGSTGVARTIAAAKYLTRSGWEVTVLTVQANAYEMSYAQNDALIPEGVRVERAWALDAKRHLSVRGKYLLATAVPDRWQSWIVGGFARGKRIIDEWKPDVILSTYPIASALCIGYLLHRYSNIPWVAELRDPMAQEDYPKERSIYRAFEWIERRIFRFASRVVVTTQGCADLYVERFPSFDEGRIQVIPNGFDPEMFDAARIDRSSDHRGAIRLLHSGLMYPEERDPTHLFEALARLKKDGIITTGEVEFAFRGSGNEAAYAKQIERLGLQDDVALLPPIPYQAAVEEMMAADGLLLLQASNCNHQIPAKLYEYLYCERPVLGLADPVGDTGRLLGSLGIDAVAPLESTDAIAHAIAKFLDELRRGQVVVPPRSEIVKFSRRHLVGQLDTLLDSVSR